MVGHLEGLVKCGKDSLRIKKFSSQLYVACLKSVVPYSALAFKLRIEKSLAGPNISSANENSII